MSGELRFSTPLSWDMELLGGESFFDEGADNGFLPAPAVAAARLDDDAVGCLLSLTHLR